MTVGLQQHMKEKFPRTQPLGLLFIRRNVGHQGRLPEKCHGPTQELQGTSLSIVQDPCPFLQVASTGPASA